MSGIHVIGGGTFSPVRNHLAICAPAFGEAAIDLAGHFGALGVSCALHLTKMADRSSPLVTNADVAALVDRLLDDPATRVVVMSAALCDFDGRVGDVPPGFHAPRLKSRDGARTIEITPADKVIGRIRGRRPDVVAVGFKTTTQETPAGQLGRAIAQVAESDTSLVLANDTVTRFNLVVPAGATALSDCLAATTDRQAALRALAGAAVSLAGLPGHPGAAGGPPGGGAAP